MPLHSRLEPGVQRALFRVGYKIIPASLVGGFASAVLMGLTLWQLRGSTDPLWWMAVALLANAGAWSLLLFFRREALLREPSLLWAGRWRLCHTLFVTGATIAWSGTALLLDPADPGGNMLILSAYLAVLAFSASSHGMHNFPSFIISAVLSMPVMLWFLPQAFSAGVGPIRVLFFLFGVACTIIARNVHRTFVEAIRLRLANEQLAAQRTAEAARADRASREKSDFLAAVAHDIRQPVHALMMLQPVLRQARDPQEQQQVLGQMEAASRTIGQLFTSLAELSSLESGQRPVRAEAIGLRAFVEARLPAYAALAADKHLGLRVHVAPSVSAAHVQADPVLLMRILDNLVGNALRYTERGGVLISLRRHSVRKVWLEVWDTGTGIASEDLDRIFDPYVQLDNPARRRERGLGLGLAIVRNAAELMAVPIQVHSRPGRGSRFRIALGRVAAGARSPVPAVDAASKGALPPDLAGRRVLLVEDDPMVSQALSSLLQHWGAQVRLVADPQAGLKTPADAQAWRPDLLLCDFRLPGPLDGLQLIEQARDQWPGLACILQSGEIAPEVALRAGRLGCQVLIKPVDSQTLADVLMRALQARPPGEAGRAAP